MGRDLSQFASPASCVCQEIDFKEESEEEGRAHGTASCSCRCVGSATVGEEHASIRALVARSGAERERKNLEGHSRNDRGGCPQARIDRANHGREGGRALGRGPYQTVSSH